MSYSHETVRKLLIFFKCLRYLNYLATPAYKNNLLYLNTKYIYIKYILSRNPLDAKNQRNVNKKSDKFKCGQNKEIVFNLHQHQTPLYMT